MLSETAMRKWICAGVIGGLLEFGIVYQVAFYEPEASSPKRVHASAETKRPKASGSRREATKRLGRSDRTVAAAAQAATESAVTATLAKSHAAAPAAAPAADQQSPQDPAPAGVQAGPAQPDSLTTLLTAASEIASRAALYPVAALQAVTAPASPGAGQPAQPGAPVPGLDLGQVLPLPGNPAAPPAPAKPLDLASLSVEEMIRHVFGPHGDKAVQVARCESTLRTHAKRGEFLGLFQMGANERADYGHGPDALAQVLAAHKLFLHRGWQPWTCA